MRPSRTLRKIGQFGFAEHKYRRHSRVGQRAILKADIAVRITLHADVIQLTARRPPIPRDSPPAVRRHCRQILDLHLEHKVARRRSRLGQGNIVDNELRNRTGHHWWRRRRCVAGTRQDSASVCLRMARVIAVNDHPVAGIADVRGRNLHRA